MGLMKLATYHKQLGDTVRFFKGNLYDLIISDIVELAIKKYTQIDNSIVWQKYYDVLKEHIKFGKKNNDLDELIKNSPYFFILNQWFDYYRNYYKTGEYKKHPKWDRICITTLFTFYWEKTVETIEIAKTLIKNENELFIGGILATVLHEELKQETNIKSIQGLLNRSGILDDNDIVIDTLPLDYSILFEIDYKYPADNAFYAYSTRGCKNRCSFCAVPILEPDFEDYIPIIDAINHVKQLYGDKPNLLLMDNNVLLSNNFRQIIADIKKCGFGKGDKFIQPNYLQIYIRNLKDSLNDYAFMRAVFEQYKHMLEKLKGEEKQFLYNILKDSDLLNINTITKKTLLNVYPLIKNYYEKYQSKTETQRIVDFNQGLDAVCLTEEKVKLLSEIAIKPLRIAFDSLKEKDVYKQAVSLCAKYGITSLSNYLLYNEKDKPNELYQRLKINIRLCEQLSISIYSFPMKYHPISGDHSKDRDFIGKYWNRKYIRAVQTILNATKGKIGRGKSFFYEAFGKSVKKFNLLLIMPESYLLYRFFFKDLGYITQWKEDLIKLNKVEKRKFLKLVKKNIFNNTIYENIENKNIKNVYYHYLIKRDAVLDKTSEIGKLKIEYDEKSKEVSDKS